MSPSPCKVAVVGGGIGGLTVASALDPRFFDVVVYEAQPERATGSALGLWASSRRALERLGVSVVTSAPDRQLVLHTLAGRRLMRLPTPAVAQLRRPLLMEALRAAVPSTVTFVHDEVLDPTTLDADLVIGADGVRSQVRAVVAPTAATRWWTPWVTLRGIDVGPDGDSGHDSTKGDADCSASTAREFWGRGCLFGDAPVAGGRYWFTAHRSQLGPEPLAAAEVLAEARERFSGAAPVIQTRLEGAASDVLATRLWTTPPLARYCRGRYVVIGDAAHASLPNLGRGASDAILDAVTLARTLNTGGSLAGWEARRVPATQVARAVAGVGMRVATGPWWSAGS